MNAERWFAAAHRLGLGPELDAVALHAAFSARADLPPNCFLTVNVDPESLLPVCGGHSMTDESQGTQWPVITDHSQQSRQSR